MKKTLLLLMLVGIVFSGIAQKKTLKTMKLLKRNSDVTMSSSSSHETPILNSKVTNEDIDRIEAGKAQFSRSVRREDHKAISYNKELDIISITFLLDPVTYGTNSTDIGMVYSADKGQTWSDVVVINEEGANNYINDYPSGIVYNPIGNTNYLDAFGLIQNISHIGASWSSQYKMFASRTLGGEHQDIEIIDNSNHEADYWNQFGLRQIGEEVRCLSVWPEGGWGEYTAAALNPIYGEFNNNTFIWDESQTIDMDFYLFETGDLAGSVCWTGVLRGFDSGTEMAWSEDGEIGYIWVIGCTADDPTGMQPIVYRTDNGGSSWDMLDLEIFEDEGQEMFAPFMPPTYNDVIIPRVAQSAGIVDYHGDLQMAIIADAYATDVVAHPDSLSESLSVYMSPGDVYNLEINEDGLQNVIYIDSLFTDVIVDESENCYGTQGWTHRLSIAKNDFENEFFVTWTDSRIVEDQAENTEPDIFGWSRNIHTGNQTDPVCFTEGTLYEKFYYFTYGADDAYYNGDSHSYTVPYMQTVDPGEFGNGNEGAPVTISYVTGIEFPAQGEHVSVSEMANISGISVSQNNPNPFNGYTTITVSTETTSSVNIEISNIMGQTIRSFNAGTVNGTKEINISAENMEAGVYFYTVTVGNEKITKKMIVK